MRRSSQVSPTVGEPELADPTIINEPPAGVTDLEAGAVLAFDVPLQQPGRYRFEIAVDGTVQSIVPIGVSQTPQTPPTRTALH